MGFIEEGYRDEDKVSPGEVTIARMCSFRFLHVANYNFLTFPFQTLPVFHQIVESISSPFGSRGAFVTALTSRILQNGYRPLLGVVIKTAVTPSCFSIPFLGWGGQCHHVVTKPKLILGDRGHGEPKWRGAEAPRPWGQRSWRGPHGGELRPLVHEDRGHGEPTWRGAEAPSPWGQRSWRTHVEGS